MADPEITRNARSLFVAAVWLTVTGCATQQNHYAWGSYEDLIYVTHAKPGTLTPEDQVQRLEQDRLSARAANKPLPPGWRAHLGYLYFQTGHADQAREELLAEKTVFPESTTFVDHLLANLAAAAGAAK